jgi:hypothetical protein
VQCWKACCQLECLACVFVACACCTYRSDQIRTLQTSFSCALTAFSFMHICVQEYTLHFLQEPPHGVAHWLQCWAVGPKSNLTLTHTFTPPVEVTVLHNGELMEPKDACKLLEKGIQWRYVRQS